MKTTQFKGVILDGHKGAAVEAPFDPSKRWGIPARALWRGRRGHAVRGRLNGVPFESFIVARSGRFWMPVDAKLQAAAKAWIGATVAVTVEPRLPQPGDAARVVPRRARS